MRRMTVRAMVALAATVVVASVLPAAVPADPANVGGYRAVASNAAFSFDVGVSSYTATVFTGSMAPWQASSRDYWTLADLNVSGPDFSIYECFQQVPDQSYIATRSHSTIDLTMSCLEGVSGQMIDVTVDLSVTANGQAVPYLSVPPDFETGFLLDTFTRAGGTVVGSISFLGETYPIDDAQGSIWTAMAHYVQTP